MAYAEAGAGSSGKSTVLPHTTAGDASDAEEESVYDTQENWDRYLHECEHAAEFRQVKEKLLNQEEVRKRRKAAQGGKGNTTYAVEGQENDGEDPVDNVGKGKGPPQMTKKMQHEELVQQHARYRIEGTADYGCPNCSKVYKACAGKFFTHVANCTQPHPPSQKQVCPPAHTQTRCSNYMYAAIYTLLYLSPHLLI